MITALKGIGKNNDRRPTRESREARYSEECKQCRPDPRPAIPIVDPACGARKCLIEIADAKRWRDSCESRAESEYLSRFCSLSDSMGDLEMVRCVMLHGAGNIDQQQQLSRDGLPAPERRLRYIAVCAYDLPQGPAEVDAAARVGSYGPKRTSHRKRVGKRAAEPQEFFIFAFRIERPNRKTLG